MGVGSDAPVFGLGKNPSQEACMHFILVRVLACQAQVSCKGFFHFWLRLCGRGLNASA
jgi:hypothetical protein